MKKLYRLKQGKKIAGICAGFADLFEIDVTVVRLLFVFITILTQVWPGVVTYLVAWYLIKEKEIQIEEINKG